MMDAILLLRKMQATNNLKAFKVGGCSKQPQKGAATYVQCFKSKQSLASTLSKKSQKYIQVSVAIFQQIWA